jgi:hypothetical protein
MGNGLAPGPLNELGEPIRIDDGTLSRTGSPPPGPIGLDSKGGSSKGGSATMADQIVAYARQRNGERAGDGECFTLVDRALRGAGAQSAADYGRITPDADYVWGASVNLSELRPGDVVQFRNYRYERTDITDDDSGTTTREQTEERLHHTAIVQSVDGDAAVTVWEQNSPPGSAVRRIQLFFTNSSTSSGNRTTTIRVHGTSWFYRPQAR